MSKYKDHFQIRMIQERLGVRDCIELCKEEHKDIFDTATQHGVVNFLRVLGKPYHRLNLDLSKINEEGYKSKFLRKCEIISTPEVQFLLNSQQQGFDQSQEKSRDVGKEILFLAENDPVGLENIAKRFYIQDVFVANPVIEKTISRYVTHVKEKIAEKELSSEGGVSITEGEHLQERVETHGTQDSSGKWNKIINTHLEKAGKNNTIRSFSTTVRDGSVLCL